MKVCIPDGNLVRSAVGVPETNPPRPFIAIRVACPTEDFKGAADDIPILKKSCCGHPIGTKRHSVISSVELDRQLVEIII